VNEASLLADFSCDGAHIESRQEQKPTGKLEPYCQIAYQEDGEKQCNHESGRQP
jgi:hypothetical protein